MDKKELLNELNNLLNQIDEYEKAKSLFNDASEEAEHAQHIYPMNLKTFDNREKERYINSLAGQAPEKPKRTLIGYKAKKKDYESSIEQYSEEYKRAEAAYESDFAAEREALRKKDENEYTERLGISLAAKEKAKLQLEEAERALAENDLFGDEMKNHEAISTLRGYIINNRCDSLKEAVNLFFEEKRIREEQIKTDEFRAQVLNAINCGFTEMEEGINSISNGINDLNNNANDIDFYVRNIYFDYNQQT